MVNALLIVIDRDNDGDEDNGEPMLLHEKNSCKSADVWQQERHARHRQIRDQLAAYNPDVSGAFDRPFLFVCRSLVLVCLFAHAEDLRQEADGSNMNSILLPKI